MKLFKFNLETYTHVVNAEAMAGHEGGGVVVRFAGRMPRENF